MPRVRLLLVALLALAVPATAAPTQAWPGRPQARAPQAGRAAPPPAWVETRERSRWMAFSSYCWRRRSTAACVDMVPVQKRSDLPILRATHGERIRLQLAFQPREAHLTIYRGFGFRHYTLRPAPVMSWRVRSFGIAVLDVKAAAGTASYAVRLHAR